MAALADGHRGGTGGWWMRGAVHVPRAALSRRS